MPPTAEHLTPRATKPGSQDYLIALGSNRRHHRIGPPAHVLRAALLALAAEGIDIPAASPVIETRPVGPSRRRYANGAAILRTDLAPDALLQLLKAIEARFGTRRGQRWTARTLDLDIILWSGGRWRGHGPRLDIPHPLFRSRRFVLEPAGQVAANWRDPVTRLTVAQLAWRAAQA